MMYNYFNSSYYGMMNGFGGGLIALIVIWSLIWKGMSLWKAARAGSKPWFVALLVLNTAGILDILYIYVFSKGDSKPVKDQKVG